MDSAPKPNQTAASKPAAQTIVTQSERMRKLIADAIRAAQSSATVLLTGESGTGKELFARIIHEHSQRSSRRYVRVNCAALSENLIESELFGHEKGSFTDAIQQRIGRFEFANGGTLLLDEITEIPLTTQAKLLRVLEEDEFQRVGSNESLTTDLRIVVTSNRELRDFIRSGKFRLDLYHRLNVVELKIPPLRERAFDIPLLATHFVRQFRKENPIEVKGFTKSAMQQLCGYHWPGNIRELRNTVHRACIVTTSPVIDSNCLTQWDEPSTAEPDQSIPVQWLRMRLDEIEREVILASISHNNSKQAAARRLGVTTRTLANKLKLYAEQRSDNERKAA